MTWEHNPSDQFDTAIKFWSKWDLPEPFITRKHKMLGLKQFTHNTDLAVWIRKAYYACMRFVRLAEFIDRPRRLLEIDIDGVLRKPIDFGFEHDADVYLYEKIKFDKTTREIKKLGHLAGSIFFTSKPSSLVFIKELALMIRQEIESDNLYWFLDQNCIDAVIPKYHKGLLPVSLIDWKMDASSTIWTAKGQRKDLEIFQREIKKYQ
jgi:hypothetical protein